MNPLRRRGTEQYLGRTYRATDKRAYPNYEVEDEMENKVQEPLTDHTWEKEGVIEFDVACPEGAPAHVRIEYDSHIDEKMESYLKPLRRVSNGPYIMDESATESVRRIKSLVIERDGYRFDLRDLVGEDCGVYMRSGAEFKNGFYDPVRNQVIVDRELLTWVGFATLFHEVGHHIFHSKQRIGNPKYSDSLAQIRRRSGKGGIFESEREALIRDERAAAAFTLRVLYRLFGDHEQFANLKMREYETKRSYYSQQDLESITKDNVVDSLIDRILHP